MTTILKEPEVERRTKTSRPTRYRWVRQGKFPAPIKLGDNSIGWIETEIEEWLASRPRQTYGAPENGSGGSADAKAA